MSLRCGIIGLPNVGKSSLFNALTEASIAAENYPFCTIEPNIGVVPVLDDRLDRLADFEGSAKRIPATVSLVDIAGLVAGASKGEGLGNKFLANIREVNALIHVLRCFDSDEIVHVANRIDPVADAKTVDLELALADLATIEKASDRLARLARSGDKESAAKRKLLAEVAKDLDSGITVRAQKLDADKMEQLSDLHLLTAKKMLYCANLGEDERPEDSESYAAVASLAKEEDAGILAICARLEAELVELEPAERQEMLSTLGWQESGVARLAQSAYRLLDLETFFTVGPKEARAWQFRRGTAAPGAAGIIHSDMQRGFIRAEIVSTEDFLDHGGESGCRDTGRLRLEGKNYLMQDGDVAHFRFNV